MMAVVIRNVGLLEEECGSILVFDLIWTFPLLLSAIFSAAAGNGIRNKRREKEREGPF